MSAASDRRDHLSRIGHVGGLTSSANMSPADRLKRASEAGKASARARAARKAAAGKSPAPPTVANATPAPEEHPDLGPYLEEIAAEGASLTGEQIFREARLRMRLDIARAADAAFRSRGSV